MKQKINIVVILVMILLIILFFSVVSRKQKSTRVNIEDNKSFVKGLVLQIDSLNFCIDSLKNEINFYEKKFLEKEKEIVNLRKNKHEEVSSIVCLPLDESINFLSEYLSKSRSNKE